MHRKPEVDPLPLDTEIERTLRNMRKVTSNVLKTGPDRPVQPVEPSTGHKTGPVQSKNRFFIETALNPPN